MNKKKFKKLLAEGYKKTEKLNLETTKEYEVTESEANKYLGEY